MVSPTVWTIGHIIPVHARDTKSKYGKGLSVTSMEGREARQSLGTPKTPTTP